MQRPGSVTTFGILNIVFGAWGILGMLMTLAMMSSPLMKDNPTMNSLNSQPAYAIWMKISIPLSFIAGAVLIAAGIGLLMMKRWARLASLVYGVYAIIMAIIGLIITVLFVVKPMMQQFSPGDPKSAAAIGGAIGGVIGAAFAILYPSLLLFFMTRRSVVVAFEPQLPPPVPIA